ncbi:two-component response regulator-like APRR5 isoform X2 [Salvia miltiorrhiza]|uniref:two-component response regulator-like APRR5 isoform X2 n=1 Tax=Salvia miltiorrhiza TaxID=226208 RepID=UPI0025ACD5A7|nr:two-component response regulator-like APRR5 isoform X2 [Salvia miltiorrhiza]
MGEVVLSSEAGVKGMENDRQQNIPSLPAESQAAAAGSSSLVRWERFLPKLAVRVLLVEADDSTRQIIAALLRKCSYKVAAVSDGLKAWEVLKARAENIDLILTEVELPAISGYALLTLIMEHDICKNIPVIMMSSYDSVSIVYKCMLRGAADFLVKPVRKNELRNLWQHVWRKQVSSGTGLGPPDESMAQQKIEATAENNATSNHSSQQKIEATAENNATSNHSSGYMACVQRNRECIEKGTDAQSSCTRPELETDGPDVEHAHSLLQPKTNTCFSNNINIFVHKECQEESRRTRAHDDETGGLQTVASIDVNYGTTRGQDKNSSWEQVNVTGQDSKNNNVREAIDLIGAFSNCCKGTLASPASNASTNKFDIFPLDLSLRRSHPSGSVNQVNDETHRINHSDASAFSRYVNKPLQPRNSTSRSTCNQQKDLETNSEKQQSNHTPEYTSDAHGSRISSQKYASVTGILPGRPEIPFSYPQLRETSQPIPVRGVRFENVINGFGAVMPQMYPAQSGLSPVPSPGTASHSQSFAYLNPFHQADPQPANSQSFRDLLDQRISCAMDQTDNKQGEKQEIVEDAEHVSFANDQSPNSGFYNGYTSHHHSIGSGDIGKINVISVGKDSSDAASEEGAHVHEGGSSRSMQREAALTKFRLKRKERCFEKKVRYESRRKLAEQRPRVKGQFVRQIPDDAQPAS